VRDVPAIVASVFDAAFEAVRVHHTALREAEFQHSKAVEIQAKAIEQVEKSTKRVEHWKKEGDAARLATGKALAEVRPRWPKRGPNAKGWSEYLDREGIDIRNAHNWMALAGHGDDISESTGIDSENSPDAPGEPIPVPTQRQVAAARKEQRQSSNDNTPKFDPDDVDPSTLVDIRIGDWRDALSGIGKVNSIIVDPPYSERTHAAGTTRSDGTDAAGLTPTYGGWTPDDVHAFVRYWAPRCEGWMVALTDSELAMHWRDAYREAGRYAFAPVPCVITGMSVRISGDGPSSWAVYAMVSRPAALIKWGTLPGAYVGGTERGSGGGRGKPSWLMDSLVRDYTRAGDLVCDPMSGFGSTLFAALRNGCRAIGSEIDPEARTEALKRAREELAQPSKAPRTEHSNGQ
jgi:hypothetical protein